MSKDAYYFPHDSNARHDPKITEMISVYGMAGYAWYWVIIEMLREQEGYRYSFERKYALNAMAREMQCSVDEAERYIEDCVEEFELFALEDKMPWCPSLDKRMQRLDRRRERAKKAANARWNKTKIEELEFDEEPKKVNPEKVKSMEVLTNSLYFAYLCEELKESEDFSKINNVDKFLKAEKDVAVDWMRSKGKRYKDYRAMFRNWIRRKLNENKNGESFTSNNPQLKNPYDTR